jgi:hypothetical protein
MRSRGLGWLIPLCFFLSGAAGLYELGGRKADAIRAYEEARLAPGWPLPGERAASLRQRSGASR